MNITDDRCICCEHIAHFRGRFRIGWKSPISTFSRGAHKAVMGGVGDVCRGPLGTYLTKIQMLPTLFWRPRPKIHPIHLLTALTQIPSVRFSLNFVTSCIHIFALICEEFIDNLGPGLSYSHDNEGRYSFCIASLVIDCDLIVMITKVDASKLRCIAKKMIALRRR